MDGLTPPPGYATAVPFERDKHGKFGVRGDAAGFARALNAIVITTDEFVRAGRDHPIAFAPGGDGQIFPVVVTGLNSGTNLNVDADGNWDGSTYCPAYVRRYPFFTASVRDGSDECAVVCVDEAALSRDTTPLFDASGQASERWQTYDVLIREMDEAVIRSARFCKRLVEFNVLEPFEVEFHPHSFAPLRVSGLQRIAKNRLHALADTVLALLVRDGYARLMYAHELSLGNFDRLLDRFVAKASSAPP